MCLADRSFDLDVIDRDAAAGKIRGELAHDVAMSDLLKGGLHHLDHAAREVIALESEAVSGPDADQSVPPGDDVIFSLVENATLSRGLIWRLWQQTGKCAATMTGKVRCWAHRQRDQVLPPPDLWHQQCRRDILRIEARRIL